MTCSARGRGYYEAPPKGSQDRPGALPAWSAGALLRYAHGWFVVGPTAQPWGARVIRIVLLHDRIEAEHIAEELRAHDIEATLVSTAAAAQAAVCAGGFAAVVVDVRAPSTAIEHGRAVAGAQPGAPVLVLVPRGALEWARAAAGGAYTCLVHTSDIGEIAAAVRDLAGVATRAPPGATRVLLVDDNEDFVECMTLALQLEGLEVVGTTDANRALTALAHTDFDVALVDLVMPDMNGLELLTRIKRLRPLTEVVMLTGHPSARQALEGLADGAFDFLPKPAGIAVVAARVRRACEARRRKAE